jgi:signal transduction histidine kinase
MTDLQSLKSHLIALGQYLRQQRAQILRAWQLSEELDPHLTTPSSISLAQFNDHIPQLLDAFERRLVAQEGSQKVEASADQKHSAAEHGLHRWQQGYNQRETIREWGHLQLAVLQELDEYARAHPELPFEVMATARRALVRLCGEGVSESAARYEQLQRSEAASRMRDLEAALIQVQALDRERAENWREAAHDLRGTVGVISNASAILARQAEADPRHAHVSQVLQRSVASLRALLTDLMDLARLEAGQDRRHLQPFDAAAVLREFCETLRPLASQHSLFLKAEGPPTLPVVGDSTKVLRIAQNLALNALKVTERGGVRILWDERDVAGARQWVLCVQDTGPGFQAQSPSAPMESALRHATAESNQLNAQQDDAGGSTTSPAPTLRSQSPAGGLRSTEGEGIGLSIVKRLCELLDASLELETAPGAGTTFRVVFPRSYAEVPRSEPTR